MTYHKRDKDVCNMWLKHDVCMFKEKNSCTNQLANDFCHFLN